ncbi:hypothetical protein CJ030_MR6G003166 [Morella rubra]|uniref:Uncharacterized protein n=1 Tax=Morella rubra TaxID=262757 RepID=A0A6A1VB95_9ROSI|nr:hypothetical protein CJ030_MR6G003166 [Morella rubra]
MPRTKHVARGRTKGVGSSRSTLDLLGEPAYFFRNSECAEIFYNDFSKRKVMPGRKVNISSLLDFEIDCLFEKQGLENLLDMGNKVFPMYVRIFFYNLTARWEDRGLFTLRSMVVLNEVILGDILAIPHVGIWAYEIKTWPMCKGFDYGEALVYLQGNIMAADAPRKIHANQLKIHSRLLHLICTYNLIPRGGHLEEVTFMDVFLVERLLKEKRKNVPKDMDEEVSDDDEDEPEAEDKPEAEELLLLLPEFQTLSLLFPPSSLLLRRGLLLCTRSKGSPLRR